MNRNSSYTNTTAVETELNQNYSTYNNYDIDKEDVQLFVALNDYNYYPLETYIDKDGKFVIEDNINAKNKDVYIGSKRQFLYKQYIVSADTIGFDLDETFKSGWNPNHYHIFRNGLKLNPNMYIVKCPTLDNVYDRKTVYTFVKFLANDRLDVFYIEDNDNFKPIRFSQDMYIRSIKVYTKEKDQVLKIPYPYKSYPNDPSMFYIFDPKTKKYLVEIKDYILETVNSYVRFRDEYPLDEGDYMVFVFPYCVTDYTEIGIDSLEEISNFNIHKCTGISKSGNDVVFAPEFNDYTLTKENVLLFYRDNIVDQSKYTIKSNTVFEISSSGTASDYYFIAIELNDEYVDSHMVQMERHLVTPVVYE